MSKEEQTLSVPNAKTETNKNKNEKNNENVQSSPAQVDDEEKKDQPSPNLPHFSNNKAQDNSNVKTPGIYSRTQNDSSSPNVLGSPLLEDCDYEIFRPNELKNGQLYKYDYRDLHSDLEKQKYCGVYGWDNAPYWGIAETKAGVDLHKHYCKRSDDEVYLQEWIELLEHKETQKWWPRIVTFDPYGMTATNPTIAATDAILNIMELGGLKRDGLIVDEDGGVHCQKAAIYNCWNLPALALRLELSEEQLRKALYKYSGNESVKDPKLNAFLPCVGGCTVYVFGSDIRKIRDNATEIAVRVHDECNGSDVFGTDICTCRPYLIFALIAAIECAQRGGIGIVAYFRKEGRSLGEITKYRVYNARKNQVGGDRADTYFQQTENICGIRDARFQTMMPDVLNWLGIDRIDWLLSMSSEKYDAIISAGITVNQRVPLPDSYVPKHANVEVSAKIAAGYHAECNSYEENEAIDALRSLTTIRKQCQRIFRLAKMQKLSYFNFNISCFDVAVREVVSCINEHYPDHNVPSHSRFRHFEDDCIANLCKKWDSQYRVSKKEQVRRLVDLVTISVLLDAGAGSEWKYIDGPKTYNRSEGLAQASFNMFMEGIFSSDVACKTRVNSVALKGINVRTLQIGFQVSHNNQMVGLEGRCGLLRRLGEALEMHKEYFGSEIFRPGHLLDYLLLHCNDDMQVSINVLWRAVICGLESIWPKQMSGIRRGDVWVHNKLKKTGIPGSDMVPFHKLQQWLTYSLVEAFEHYGITFTDMHLMTCLAEYRNGGLFVDTGVLSLKPNVDANKYYDVGSELVVEWRAMTVVLVDKMAERIRTIYNKTDKEFPLSKVLEGGTWRAGRELAFKLRKNGESPIKLRSDGTVF